MSLQSLDIIRRSATTTRLRRGRGGGRAADDVQRLQ
jgi:hypothetical protein